MRKPNLLFALLAFAIAVFFACTENQLIPKECTEENEEDCTSNGGEPEPGVNYSSSSNNAARSSSSITNNITTSSSSVNNQPVVPSSSSTGPVCPALPPPVSGSSSSAASTGTGGCIPPPGQGNPPNGVNTCIVVNGKCYKCNPDRGNNCLETWLWDGQQVTSDWWFTEVACSGTGTAANLICSGFSSQGTAGVAINRPTVMCGSTAASGVTFSPSTLNFASPAMGCYDVTATASCGGSNKTASCGRLIVNNTPTLTCAALPQTTGTVGSSITSPMVQCGSTNVAFGSITWAGNPNWSNAAAGTYNNVRATASCGGISQTANCTGSITVTTAGTTPSSSSVRSSSSSSSITSGGGGNCGGAVNYPTLTSGTKGWASRYWDGCKQSCSWGGKQQYAPLTSSDRCKACERNGTTQIAANDMNKSSCDGGNSYTCYDFTPCKVNDNLAYAFAASPTDQCGKCFQIQFDGGFQHGNANATHQAIKGKTLIVMTSNMGGDVQGGQFDVLIPGGGVGAFDAFSSQTGISKNDLGEQYGGMLSACEKSTNYNSSQYKSCLTTKCNLFTNATLKEGCLFYANWMEAANNPTMIYKEVTCPQYLIDKYKATMK